MLRRPTNRARRTSAASTLPWRTLLDGYGSITAGFEHGEQDKLASGRQAMLQWRDTIVEVAEELRALRDRVGVEMSDVTPS